MDASNPHCVEYVRVCDLDLTGSFRRDEVVCHSQQGLVVVKTYFDTEDDEDGVPQEVRILQSLPCRKNLTELIAVHPDFPSPGKYTLVEKYSNGGLLGEFIEFAEGTGQEIPELLIWHIFVQVSLALRSCVDRGVSQGSINPGSVSLHFPSDTTDYPDVVLSEFGFSEFGGDNPIRTIGKLGFLMKQLMQSPSGCADQEDWSDLLWYWVDRCTGKYDQLPLTHELAADMVPPVQELLSARGSLKLPSWASRYFSDRIDSTNLKVENALAARQDPLFDSIENDWSTGIRDSLGSLDLAG